MKAITTLGSLMMFGLLSISPMLYAQYAEHICQSPLYDCYKVKKGETWESLFPNAENRLIVKKINRMNINPSVGMIIAIPKDKEIDANEYLTYSPFPLQIPAPGEELVQVQLSTLAWGAYDPNGKLLNWGPISGGKACNKMSPFCKSILGTYSFYRKQGGGCTSSKYPLPRGGAPMPYCMHFKGGFAMHGSPVVPGYHASHGCVRMFTEDAKWLNQEFVDLGDTKLKIVQ